MSNAFDVHIATLDIPADLAHTGPILVPVFRAPAAANGGGVTILEARAYNGTALAGAGTTFTLTLVNGGTTGLTAEGTIGAAIGSATQWSTRTFQSWTIDATKRYVGAGEWVSVQYDELNGGNNAHCHIEVAYIMGN